MHSSAIEHVTQMFSAPGTRFMPYFPVGYPNLQTSINILEGLAWAGADAIEIGVPFSDPLADGPVVQAATQTALANGIRLPDCIEAVRELRRRGVSIPLFLMGYFNPFLAYGLEQLLADATDAGVSGFIVPDLPVDEAGEFQALIDKHGLALPYFLAPTSNDERIALAVQNARGFIYVVSVTGVTGVRETLPDDLREFVARVRRVTNIPLGVGFGIATPEKAREVAKIADGIFIGSKLITLADESSEAVLDFAREVRQALD